MEAINGSFVYRDTLFANVGEGKRIPRATVADLNALLLPKKNAAPIKDETANFYVAQLMHYGLPKTKDKNTAKVRLTTALSAGQLSVPSDVQKIETDLKKEYASLQRKAKLAAKKENKIAPPETAASQKRKASAIEETIISFTSNGISLTINQTSTSTAVKKQKSSAIKTAVKKSPAKAIVQKTTQAAPAKVIRANMTAKPITKTPQTARSKQHPSLKKPIQTARKSEPPPRHAASDDEGDAPPPYSVYDNQDEDDYYDQGPKLIQISGDYEVTAPAHDSHAMFELRLSHPRDQLWGRFTLCDRRGLIRIDGIGDIARGTRKSFGWRSEDLDTGTDLKFGKNCDGWMQFDGNGGLQGVFFGFKTMGRFKDVSFQGGLTEDYSYESDDERNDIVESMEREWHSFPERAYGR